MDYRKKSEHTKKIQRIYNEFLIDIQGFQDVLNAVFIAKEHDEIYKSNCNYLHELLDQIESAIPEVKKVTPYNDEITQTATDI